MGAVSLDESTETPAIPQSSLPAEPSAEQAPSDQPVLTGQAVAAAVHEAVHGHLREHLAKMEQLLASSRRRLPLGHQLPAWLRPTDGENRWPITITVLLAIGLQLVLPVHLQAGPHLLLPGMELILLVLLVAANPKRINRDHAWIRAASLVLVAVASLANIWSAVRLVVGLVQGHEGEDAGPLLVHGGAIWITNVIVFALWYWEFDRGGSVERAKASRTQPDFLFPQMQTPDLSNEHWEPTFVDYLYLSFTNATAFSPTDTLPLSRWAKMMMMTQSGVSLATVALVIARAVNILK
jgi:uncharacterized membrane protein